MLERSKNTWPRQSFESHGQQRLPGCAKQEVLEVIGLSENAGVPAVALDVLDPVRARQLLHQWLDASQAVHDPGLEPDLTGIRPGRSRTDALCWRHRLGLVNTTVAHRRRGQK